MTDNGTASHISQYDEDHDAYMLPPISQRGLHGDSGDEMPLTWHFSQVFGERSPGEDVLDGAWPLCSILWVDVVFLPRNDVCTCS